ncbi:hypothetical protein C8Q76DRAFT_740318 [Earliella scabrosa]|nr:hypothetical protein C8Q76DRAFT_740318 [Earliella scabrosa]
MPPVTRFAAMKYVEGTTDAQKRQILDGLRTLYDNEYVTPGGGFRGGKNNNPEGFDKGYDIVFTTQFKSQEARDQFTADPRNVGFKEQIVGLVADVVVYDFEDNDWGY